MYIFKYSSELPLPSLDSINFLHRHGKSVNIVYIINNTSNDEKYINLYKQYLILLWVAGVENLLVLGSFLLTGEQTTTSGWQSDGTSLMPLFDSSWSFFNLESSFMRWPITGTKSSSALSVSSIKASLSIWFSTIGNQQTNIKICVICFRYNTTLSIKYLWKATQQFN